MLDQVCSLAVQVLDRRKIVGLQMAAVDDKNVVAGGVQLLDRGPADEPCAAEHGDPHTAATCGFFSTIRSIKPQSFACSGVMKKSRSMARSTSSSGRLQCFE